MVAPPTTPNLAEHEDAATEAGRASGAQAAARKRYNIILRIRHPRLDPAEITAALGWEPHAAWKAGDQAMTPKGTRLPGVRRDGLWSCSFHYKGESRIAEQLDQILRHLVSNKALFRKLNVMKARSALYVQVPGDTNIGSRLPWQMLKEFADLEIDFEFETFPKWD